MSNYQTPFERHQAEMKVAMKNVTPFAGVQLHPSAPSPSPLMMWWDHHSDLKRQGLPNEIDEARAEWAETVRILSST